jgi:hypothetical protein
MMPWTVWEFEKIAKERCTILVEKKNAEINIKCH